MGLSVCVCVCYFHLDTYYQSITTLIKTHGTNPFQVCVCVFVFTSMYLQDLYYFPSSVEAYCEY